MLNFLFILFKHYKLIDFCINYEFLLLKNAFIIFNNVQILIYILQNLLITSIRKHNFYNNNNYY